jgi:hypothetical protein
VSTNYADILKTSWDEIPVPKLLPQGSFTFKCRDAKFVPPKKEGDRAQVMFVYEAVEAMSDVPEAAMQELGEGWESMVEPIFFKPFFETPTDRARVRKHLILLGVDLSGYSIEESLKAAKGQSIVGYVVQETYVDKAGQPQTKNAIQTFVAAQ